MLLQKNRDLAAMRKITDYNSLFNEVDLTLHDYIKLQLKLHSFSVTQTGSAINYSQLNEDAQFLYKNDEE